MLYNLLKVLFCQILYKKRVTSVPSARVANPQHYSFTKIKPIPFARAAGGQFHDFAAIWLLQHQFKKTFQTKILNLPSPFKASPEIVGS